MECFLPHQQSGGDCAEELSRSSSVAYTLQERGDYKRLCFEPSKSNSRLFSANERSEGEGKGKEEEGKQRGRERKRKGKEIGKGEMERGNWK